MATDIYSLKDKNDSLVVMARDAAVLATPYGVGTIPSKITTNAQNTLLPLPTGWKSLGELDQKAGIKVTPDIKTADVEGYGSMGPRRTVKTGESVSLSFTAQESRNLNLAMFWGADLSATKEDVNGEWQFKRSYTGKMQYYSIIVIGQDENEFGPVFPYWVFPKVTITKTDAISLAMDSALVYPLTFQAFEDRNYGGFIGVGQAGTGQKAVNSAAGFSAGS